MIKDKCFVNGVCYNKNEPAFFNEDYLCNPQSNNFTDKPGKYLIDFKEFIINFLRLNLRAMQSSNTLLDRMV